MDKLELIQNRVGRIGSGENRMVGTEAMWGYGLEFFCRENLKRYSEI